MKHLLVDVETLSTHQDAIVLQFTGLIYNGPGEEDSVEAFFENCAILDLKLDVKDQHRLGRLMDKDTMDWWSGQPSAVQKHVFVPDPKRDLPADEALNQFVAFLDENKFKKRTDVLWQRGTKDGDWLISLFMSCGWISDQVPLAWYRIRDMRTAVDVMGASSKLNGYPDNVDELRAMIPGYKQHDSKSDIMLEALILRSLGVI